MSYQEERIAQFWAGVKKAENGCWEWMGTRLPRGYGRTTIIKGGRQMYTHRLAWELTHGPIPDGLFVCHTCDNPPCCNLDHLWLGTIKDNNQDCTKKGRHYSHFQGVTHCKRRHEFTPENTYHSKDGRVCRTCQRMHISAYRQTDRGRESARRAELKRAPVRRQAYQQRQAHVAV